MTKSKSTGPKTNASEFEDRFEWIYEKILYDRLSYTEFTKQASDKYGISIRMAGTLWTKGKDRIKARYEDKQDQVLENHLQQMYDLVKRAREDGNKRIEREALADISKVLGLETQKVDVTSDGKAISININLTDE